MINSKYFVTLFCRTRYMLRQPRKSSLKIIVNTGLRSLLLDYHNKSQKKKFPDPLRYVTQATLRKWGELLHKKPQYAAFPYIKEARKAAKLLNKNLFFKSALLILTYQRTLFIQLIHSVVFHVTMHQPRSSTFLYINHTQPTIPRFAPTKG